MPKKPTLKDVAGEAGVSVATASYVLNNVSNQTIPEATRKRVHEAASRLQYVQNMTARALSLGRTHMLGVLLVEDDSDLITKHISYGKFIDQLERLSLARQYRLMVARIDPRQPNFDIIQERKLDGVFVINASEHSFHAVAGRFPFGSPVVLVDAMIDDPLFRHVVPDVEQLVRIVQGMRGDDYAIVHERSHNSKFADWIRQVSGLPADRILSATRDTDALVEFTERHRGRPLLVMNEFLALRLMQSADPANIIVACTSDCPEFLPDRVTRILLRDRKAERASALMHGLLSEPFAEERNLLLSFQDPAIEKLM